MKYTATIQFTDTNEIVPDMIFKVGDVEEHDDDGIFFYLESSVEIESFRTKGIEDFIILNIELIEL